MSALEASLARIARDLDAVGRPWALVGALAVAVYAESRATLDVDVAVAVKGPEDAAAVVAELRSRGYRWRSDLGTAMTTLEIPDAAAPGLRLDLLFGLTGIEGDVARAACRFAVLPGLVLPVVRRGELIALKLLAAGEPGREHDWRDVRALFAGAGEEDFAHARSAVRLMVARAVPGARRAADELERLAAGRW